MSSSTMFLDEMLRMILAPDSSHQHVKRITSHKRRVQSLSLALPLLSDHSSFVGLGTSYAFSESTLDSSYFDKLFGVNMRAHKKGSGFSTKDA